MSQWNGLDIYFSKSWRIKVSNPRHQDVADTVSREGSLSVLRVTAALVWHVHTVSVWPSLSYLRRALISFTWAPC